MNDNDNDVLVSLMFGIFITSIIFCVAMAFQLNYWRDTAIKYGIGEYNPKTSYFELKKLEPENIKE